MRKPKLRGKLLAFFSDAGEKGGKAKTPAKIRASRINLAKARAKRWAGKKSK